MKCNANPAKSRWLEQTLAFAAAAQQQTADRGAIAQTLSM
jgi:hypothetical protein